MNLWNQGGGGPKKFGNHWFRHLMDSLDGKAVSSSETLVSTYKPTCYYNPEDQHRHLHRRENFIYHLVTSYLFCISIESHSLETDIHCSG
jgi:hypothetical protein